MVTKLNSNGNSHWAHMGKKNTQPVLHTQVSLSWTLSDLLWDLRPKILTGMLKSLFFCLAPLPLAKFAKDTFCHTGASDPKMGSDSVELKETLA